jgi:hypothetical protein
MESVQTTSSALSAPCPAEGQLENIIWDKADPSPYSLKVFFSRVREAAGRASGELPHLCPADGMSRVRGDGSRSDFSKHNNRKRHHHHPIGMAAAARSHKLQKTLRGAEQQEQEQHLAGQAFSQQQQADMKESYALLTAARASSAVPVPQEELAGMRAREAEEEAADLRVQLVALQEQLAELQEQLVTDLPPCASDAAAAPSASSGRQRSLESTCVSCEAAGLTQELFTKHARLARHLRQCDNCCSKPLGLLAAPVPRQSRTARAPLVSEVYEASSSLRAGGALVSVAEGVLAAAYARWQKKALPDQMWCATLLTNTLYDAFGRAKGDGEDAVRGRNASRLKRWEGRCSVLPSFLLQLLPLGAFFPHEVVRPTVDFSASATSLQLCFSSFSRLVRVLRWARVVHRRPVSKEVVVLAPLGSLACSHSSLAR